MASIAEILDRRQFAPEYSQYAKPGLTEADLNTNLGVQELAFRDWVGRNNIPFDPNQKGPSDYDMRGFYKALMAGDPRASNSVNPNDNMIHYPDYWKTPYHQSFSGESQWALPTAPNWNENDQLVTPDGMVVFDERNGGVPMMLKRR